MAPLSPVGGIAQNAPCLRMTVDGGAASCILKCMEGLKERGQVKSVRASLFKLEDSELRPTLRLNFDVSDFHGLLAAEKLEIATWGQEDSRSSTNNAGTRTMAQGEILHCILMKNSNRMYRSHNALFFSSSNPPSPYCSYRAHVQLRLGPDVRY
jgi:hypothetical protein